MTTADLDRPVPCEDLGTFRIPVNVPGHVVDGTGGLIGLREIRLKWKDGEPEHVPGYGATLAVDIDNLSGVPFGPERDGLPCWLMGSTEYTWDDPEGDHADATDRTLWDVGVSRAWAVTAVLNGGHAAILHRQADAEWLARQLYEAMPGAFGTADKEAFRAAVPEGAGEWSRLTARLLNHGVPRALVVTCKEYLERRKPD
jgi:hypothetical protein